MNILELNINDVKRISAVEINPTTGEPVILTGDNAQGKSSILDSIEVLLTNKGLDDPIRHGRTSGKIVAGIGAGEVEYLLERKFTRSGDTLTITGPDGCKVSQRTDRIVRLRSAGVHAAQAERAGRGFEIRCRVGFHATRC
jgi:recombinational DNA repair ATPase RecF